MIVYIRYFVTILLLFVFSFAVVYTRTGSRTGSRSFFDALYLSTMTQTLIGTPYAHDVTTRDKTVMMVQSVLSYIMSAHLVVAYLRAR